METEFGSERSHDTRLRRGAESSKDVFHSHSNNESAMAKDCSHIVTSEYDEISRKFLREKQLKNRMSLSSKQGATIHQTTNEIVWEDTSNVNMSNSNTNSSRVMTGSKNPEGHQAKMHCFSAWDSSKFLLKLPNGDNPASSKNNLQFPTDKSESSIDVVQAEEVLRVQGNQEKNSSPILFGDMFDGGTNVEYGSRNFGMETPMHEVSADSFQMNPTKSRLPRNMSDDFCRLNLQLTTSCEMWRDFQSQEGFHEATGRFHLQPSLSRVSSQSLGSNTSHGSSQFDIKDQTSLECSQVDIQPLTSRGSSHFDLCDGTSGGYDIQYPPSNGTSKIYIQPSSIQYGPNSQFDIQPPASHGSSQFNPQPQASYGFSRFNLQPSDSLESSQHDNHPPAICGSSQFNILPRASHGSSWCDIQPPANIGSSQFNIQHPDSLGNSQFNIQSPVSHRSSHLDIQSAASRESNLFVIPTPTNQESCQDNPIFHGSVKSFSDIPFGRSSIEETSVTGRKSGVRSITFNHVPDFEPDIIGIHQRDDSNETPTPRLERETPSRDCDQLARQSNSYSSTGISSKDHVFKIPQAVPKSVSTPSSSEVYSSNQVDPGTASKLSAFSHRLRALTSATSALVTKTPLKSGGRDNSTNPLVTPRNKTPDSRLVTPRSCTTTTPLGTETNYPDPDCFLSVIEGRGSARCEVGVAAICLSNPTLILCQFSDSSTYPRTLNKLLALNPCEVIFPSTSINPMMSASTGVKLYDDISNSFSLCKVIPIHRKYFNESKGILAIKQFMVPEISSVEMQFHNKFYCLAAANALLKYVEFTHKFSFSRHSLKVDYQVADKSTVIDPATAEHIELMTCLGHRKSKLSLFGVLNHCSTQGGLRLLRSNLFQPPIDLHLIQARQEAIAELMDRTDLYDSLKTTMSRFPDLESVLSLCIRKSELHITLAQVDVKMDQMISLRQIFHLMPSLSSALEKSQQSRLLMSHAAVLKKHLSSSALLLEMLNLVINDNISTRRGSGAAMKFHRAMAIKPDVNGLLDIARRTFSECVDQLKQYVTELGDESALPLKMGWNSQRGFFIQLTSTRTQKFSVKDLPDYFQHIQKQKNQISFVTTEFAVKHQLVKNTLREISTMSNSILDELLAEVREYIGFLHQLSETLCSLDMLLSLASVSMAPGFCKPNFGDLICVRQGRHPILNTMPVEVIPNDIMADPLSRLHVLTGPNMSGKSTYLRQVKRNY